MSADGLSNSDDVIVSEFTLMYIVTVLVFVVITFVASVFCFTHIALVENWLYVLIGWYVCILINIFYSGEVKRIIVSPMDITITYFLISRQEQIIYTDIEAIHNYRSNPNREGREGSSLTQVIELKDGTEFSFGENQMENYDKLVNAIWRYRLDAFQALNEQNAQHK